MTSREAHFLRILVEGGVMGPDAAAQLETACASEPSDSGKPVWDLAVEIGLISAEQAGEALKQAEAAEKSSTQTLVARGPGTRLGNYQLISKLGQGGMGAVYKARQETMDRLVAIKVLPKSLARNEEFITRFLREARAAGRLSHPNVVAGIDAGFADGYYYFAMEYVEGTNLGSLLHERGPLDENLAAEYGRQIALALDHAHGAGIVHRDVKPENILVTAEGQAKLCDLGLARSSGEDLRVTQAGMAVGTPYYINPEQAMGREPDARSDIYSLGCTLYHLIAGRPVFDGDNPLAIMQKHINEERTPLGEVLPGVSRALEAVVARMIARRPEDRYQTAAEAAEDLAKVVAGGVPAALGAALAARRKAARQGTGTTRSTRPASSRAITAVRSPPDRWQTRHTHWPMLIAAGSLVLVLGLAGMVWGLQGDRPGRGADGSGRVAPAPDPAEAEAERLLGDFDRNFKTANWAGAVSTGERLLKDFANTRAVKSRAELPAQVAQARQAGSLPTIGPVPPREPLPVPPADGSVRHWTGANGSRWSDPRNWAEGKVPAAGETAVFDGKSGGDCLVEAPAGLAGLSLAADYRGRLQLAAPLTVAGPLVVGGGCLDAGSHPVTIETAGGRGKLTVAGGELRLGSATHTVKGGWEVKGGRLLPGTSTVEFFVPDAPTTEIGGNFVLNHVRICTSGAGSAHKTCRLEGVLTVEGALALESYDNGGWHLFLNGAGRIEARGEVTSNRARVWGTAGVTFCGAKGDQAVTDLWWQAGPYVIDKPAGKVCWKGSARFYETALIVKSLLDAGSAEVWVGTDASSAAKGSGTNLYRPMDVHGSFTVESLTVFRPVATGAAIFDFHGGMLTVTTRLVMDNANTGGWTTTIKNVTFACQDKLEQKGDPWIGENAVITRGGRTTRIGAE
jgi:tRNA A-37 threonylcarbamoyl transferase component Bud32